jgi:hypothetical protein
MIDFPELIYCQQNNLLLKKVNPADCKYIWATAPLDELFQVLGTKLDDFNQLIDCMSMDWTTWYLMLDSVGNSFGLIRAIPELDNSISLHGIGWRQADTSARTFVLSWFAFHQFLFSNNQKIIKTYCDSMNFNAIRFDIKTGYQFEYCTPSGNNNLIVLHFVLFKNQFQDSLIQKRITFDFVHTFTFNSQFQLHEGRAKVQENKVFQLHLTSLTSQSELIKFYNLFKKSTLFYFLDLIPKPKVYALNLSLGYVLHTRQNKQNKLILFINKELTFDRSLQFVKYLNDEFKLNNYDLIYLETLVNNHNLENALNVLWKYCGNQNNSSIKLWSK